MEGNRDGPLPQVFLVADVIPPQERLPHLDFPRIGRGHFVPPRLQQPLPIADDNPSPAEEPLCEIAGYIDHSMANTSNGMIALFAAATSIRSPSCLLRLRMLHGKVDAGGAPVDFLIDLVSSSWQFWGLRPDVPKRTNLCKASGLAHSPVSGSM